jgi:hypothetical protein
VNEPAATVTADELLTGTKPASAPPSNHTGSVFADGQPIVGDRTAGPSQPAEHNPFSGVKDSLNREFQPSKFRLKDGKPQLDTQGRFVPLGLGQRRGATTSGTPPPAGSFIPPDDTPAAPEAIAVDKLAAEVAINLVQTALIMIGHDEGVLTDFERDTLRGPLARILSKYNLGDKMTPELEFAAALAVIIMSRLKKPKTQSWFQAKILAVRGWFVRRKLGAVVHNPSPAAEHKPAPGPEAAEDYLRRNA